MKNSSTSLLGQKQSILCATRAVQLLFIHEEPLREAPGQRCIFSHAQPRFERPTSPGRRRAVRIDRGRQGSG
ncbi:hypothetical protein EYF80_037977 [Liparis tanakae]|uniref:Uncharacterized protein n=1 Tax=Liparis tanakae TaxID=230148 RepID=A0A4Z2GEL0_9TELE|nr:hypothetical protein EYF80_037977 [Liparis tanakae]